MRVPPRAIMHAEPNVTPFLDVLLVLLIIFMYLSLTQQKLITAQLPDPAPPPGASDPMVVLEVRAHGAYALNTVPVTGQDLGARLRAIYAGRPTKTIIVRAASGVRYQDVVTAIDVAKGAGVVAIGLE